MTERTIQGWKNAIDDAFCWAQKEMVECKCPIQESILITDTKNYRERPDATVAFFLDTEKKRLLLRRNWASGELRYDEVANLDTLVKKDLSFVERLLENGITLSEVYKKINIGC